MHTVTVAADDKGWTVRSAAIESPLMFLGGAGAERAARRLARALACGGEVVELQIFTRGGDLAGRFVYPPPAPLPVEARRGSPMAGRGPGLPSGADAAGG